MSTPQNQTSTEKLIAAVTPGTPVHDNFNRIVNAADDYDAGYEFGKFNRNSTGAEREGQRDAAGGRGYNGASDSAVNRASDQARF